MGECQYCGGHRIVRPDAGDPDWLACVDCEAKWHLDAVCGCGDPGCFGCEGMDELEEA